MKPYYHDERSGCTIYHGDCRDILPDLAPCDVIICDPVWPNAVACLAGSDDPAGLFAQAAAHFPRLCKRLVVQLGCDSDPRFLLGVPAALPFFRVCWLQYAFPLRKGRVLHTADLAYAFGAPVASAPGRRVIPGYIVSARPDRRERGGKAWNSKQRTLHAGARRHPCPRRLEHVRWLVKWFADDGPVLDPFAGSGTTLVAAKLAGYSAVGVEVEERYCEIAARRLDNEPAMMFAPEG